MAEGDQSTSRHFATGGMLAPLAYPAFRSIWFANMAANLGFSLQGIGAAWLMTSLTPSHQMLALIQASATIPIMLLGVFAGAIADNYERRSVMLISQIAMLVASAVLVVLTWLGWITPWLLLLLTLLLGCGIALNSPAWQASVREQVGIRDLPQAISLNTIAFNLARTVGPALGGVIIALWSVTAAFAVNAICRPAMIVAIWRWRPETPPPEKHPMLPAIAAGMRFCAASSPVRRVLLRGLALGFGIAGYHALLPAVVRHQLNGNETEFGAILALFGLGSILAALVIGPARRRWGTERVLMVATGGFIAAQIGLAHVTTIAQALPATLIAGAAWVSALTTVNVAMQLRSPNAILGRCMSIYQTVTFGGMALGSWVWGLLADWRGLPFALQTAALFLAVSLLILRLFAPMPGRDEGRIDADTGEAAPM